MRIQGVIWTISWKKDFKSLKDTEDCVLHLVGNLEVCFQIFIKPIDFKDRKKKIIICDI